MTTHLRATLVFVLALVGVFASVSIAHAAGPLANPATTPWIQNFPATNPSMWTPLTGDVNDDDKTDAIIEFNGSWLVALSTGTGFAPYTVWLTGFGTQAPATKTSFVGDVTGDGRADAVYVREGSWYVAKANATGTGFTPAAAPYLTVSGPLQKNFLADVTGDGLADAVWTTGNTWFAARSQQPTPQAPAAPAAFVNPSIWANPSPGDYNRTLLGDVTGDGKADLVWNPNGPTWAMRASNGSSFASGLTYTLTNNFPFDGNSMLADVNGDGRSDGISFWNDVFRVAITNSSNQFGTPIQWGKGLTDIVGGIAGSRFFAVDLDAKIAEGATTGAAEALAVKEGRWYVKSPSIPDQIKAAGSGWTRTLDENFNGSAVDDKTWSATHYDYWLNGQNTRGTGASDGYSDRETGVYNADNNTVSGGILSQKIGVGGTASNPTYTIGSINSLGRIDTDGQYVKYTDSNGVQRPTGFRFKHGYVEARVKVPASADCGGCWPAFWMLPAPEAKASVDIWNNECFSSPEELDIFEFFPNLHDDLQYYDTHWGTCIPGTAPTYKPTISASSLDTPPTRRQVVDTKLSGEFRTYGMLWTPGNPGKIQFFVDGVAGPEVKVGIPKNYMYLILTLQRGLDNYFPNVVFPPTTNGVKMETDYIRVWE